MAEQPTQKTPKGYEIPVPTKGQVLGDLAKAAQPKKKSRRRVRRSPK